MKARIVTGLLLFGLTVYILWFAPGVWFLSVNTLLMLAAAWEWTSIVQLSSLCARLVYLIVFSAFLWLLCMQIIPLVLWLWLSLLGLLWSICELFRYQVKNTYSSHRVVRSVIGWLLLSSLWLSINLMRFAPFSPGWLLFVFLIIWSADIAAYFVGKRFGRYKLLPKVSPNKTREGLIGGLIAALIVGRIALYRLDLPFNELSPVYIFLLILFLSVASVLGDLFESMLKRQVNLKDSGKWLPGHGGFLDRFDSMIFVMPLYALMSIYFVM
jgi:phosphatidate cytidylyltransferase